MRRIVEAREDTLPIFYYEAISASSVEESTELDALKSVTSKAKEPIIISKKRSEQRLDFSIVYVNEAFSQQLGYTAEEVLGRSPRMFMGRKVDKISLRKIQNAIEHHVSISLDMVNYRKNGDSFRACYNIFPLSQHEEKKYWIAIQRNSTFSKRSTSNVSQVARFDRKLTYLRTQATNTKSISAFVQECSYAILKEVDISGIQIAQVEKHIIHYRPGISQEELHLGKRSLSISRFNLASAALSEECTKIWTREEICHFEDREWYLSRDIEQVLCLSIQKKAYSSLLFCYSHKLRTFSAEEYFFLRSIHDLIQWCDLRITSQKEALRLEKEKQILLESNTESSFLYDLRSNHLLYANKTACQRYGYSRDEFQYMCLSDLYKEPIRSSLRKELSSKNFSPDKLKGTTTHIDRKNRQLQVDISSVLYNKKNLLLIRVSDITDHLQKQKREEIRLTELLARNEELQRFAYASSHNLRAPIVNLCSLLGLLEKSKISDDWNKEVIEKLELSVKKLEETLADLTQVVCVREDTHQSVQEVNLHRLCKKVCEQISEDIKYNQVHIIQNFSQATIYQSRSALESIFLNLLTNAIKYRSRDRKLTIKISSKLQKNHILLTFKDNGLGINLEQHSSKLFGLYQRFHTNIASGKGIGLYLVHTQVKALNGHVEVKSKENQGTTFYIYLKNCKQHEKNMDRR